MMCILKTKLDDFGENWSFNYCSYRLIHYKSAAITMFLKYLKKE